METQNPTFEWLQKSGKNCLKFTFKAKLTEQMSMKATKRWQEAFNERPGEKIILIWDCMELNSYETGARIHWQCALRTMKDQIQTIWVITTSKFISMGARAISLFTSFKITIVSSESQIRIE